MPDPTISINPPNEGRSQPSPYQQSVSMLDLYRPLVRTAGPSGEENSMNASLAAIFKPSQNVVGGLPDINTTLPLTTDYEDASLGFVKSRDNENVYAKAMWGDGWSDNFLAKQMNGSYGPLSVGWWGGLATKAVGKFIDGFGSIYELAKYGGHGLGEYVGLAGDDDVNSFGQWMTEGGDNFLNTIGGGIDKGMDRLQRTYQETGDAEKGLFNRLFTDAELWNTSIKDGAAFMASAFIPVGAISKLGLGAKLAGRLGKVATALEAEVAAAGIIGRGGNIVAGVNKFGSLGKVLNQARLAKTIDFGANLAYSVPMEASMEARGVGLSVRESLWGAINPQTGLMYTDEEKDQVAGAAASQVFNQNLGVLALSNAAELYGMMKIAGLASKASKAAFTAESTLGNLVGKTNKAFSLRNGSGIRNVGGKIGIGIASEGYYEENVQYAIQKTAEGFSRAEGDENESAYGSVGVKNGKIEKDKIAGARGRYGYQLNKLLNPFVEGSTDKELNESVFIGALMGAGGGGVAGVKDFKQQNKFNRLGAASINNLYQQWVSSPKSVDNPFVTETDPKTGEEKIKFDQDGKPVIDTDKAMGYKSHVEDMLHLRTIVDAAENKGNLTVFEMGKSLGFTKMAAEYAKYGATEDLIEKLSKVGGLKPEDIKLMFPSLDTSDIESPEFKTKLNKKVAEMTNVAKEVKQAHDFIDGNVLYYTPTKEETDEYNKQTGQTLKRNEHGQRMFNAKKQWLLDQSNQNLALKMYDNTIKEDNQKILQDLNNIQQARDILEDSLSPEIMAHNTAIDDTNQVIIKGKGLSNHLASLEKTMQDYLTNNPSTYSYDVAVENIEEIEKAQKELEILNEDLKTKEEALRNSSVGTNIGNDGYHTSKSSSDLSMDELDLKQRQKINDVKREEIKLSQVKLIDEYKKVIAPIESKSVSGKKIFSRDQFGSSNQRNKYYERDVNQRDKEIGRKLNLVREDIDTKKYVKNEDKLLDFIRIKEKIDKIKATINGEKLAAEIENLLGNDLNQAAFNDAIKSIKEKYTGQPITLEEDITKGLYDEWYALQEEEQDYLDADKVTNPDTTQEEKDRIEVVRIGINQVGNAIDFIEAIQKENKVNLNNLDEIRKRIANQYTDVADFIIDTYNKVSSNGTTEITGDTFSSRQDMTNVDNEIAELTRLKEIFEDRDKTDQILSKPEFKNFIEEIDERLKTLNILKDLIKDRIDSKARESEEFLKDTVELSLNEVGLSITDTPDSELFDIIKGLVSDETFTKFTDIFNRVKIILTSDNATLSEEQVKEKKANQINLYWELNGAITGLQQLIKNNSSKKNISDYATKTKAELLVKIQATNFYALLQPDQKKAIDESINDSLLATINFDIFQSAMFSELGELFKTKDFIDDNAASPVFKFRNDLNITKFINNLKVDTARDNSGTAKMSTVNVLEFVEYAKKILVLENLENNLDTELNLIDEIALERAEAEKKLDVNKKEAEYDDFIIPSIQQLFAIRKFASFVKRKTIKSLDDIGFRNWAFLQAPGGSGKTKSFGSWFQQISNFNLSNIRAVAFTPNATKSIQNAFLNELPNLNENIESLIQELITKLNLKDFSIDAIVIDEFPAITSAEQLILQKAVEDYTRAKLEATGNELKVIALGDINQLTFASNGNQLLGKPSMIVNKETFSAINKSINKMRLIPSLTQNFRTNLFSINSFISNFRASSEDLTNESVKVLSNDIELSGKDSKGVVSVPSGQFIPVMINYLNNNKDSKRSRVLIVNEKKIPGYKKALADAGINVIDDPNTNMGSGVFVTDVKNVQGFSFDEVFIDFDTKDKDMFPNPQEVSYNYNKAMYVAASRATNLIVVTNFSKFDNVKDDSINASEEKTLQDTANKDKNFIAERNIELKAIEEVSNMTGKVVPPPVVSPEPSVEPEEEEEEEEEIPTPEEEEEPQPPGPDPVFDEEEEEEEVEEGDVVDEEPEVVNEELEPKVDKSSFNNTIKNIKKKINDTYDTLKKGVINLLNNTGSTIKYQIADNIFSINSKDKNYIAREMRDGDQVSLIPFLAQDGSTGFAVVTNVIDNEEIVSDKIYRTVAILSTKQLAEITANDPVLAKKIKSYTRKPNISYADVSNKNGFTEKGAKFIEPIETGKVIHNNSVEYFYNKDNYKSMDEKEFTEIVRKYVDGFYKNYLDGIVSTKRAKAHKLLMDFFIKGNNARIVIPTRKSIRNLNLPTDFNMQVGRPYIIFFPYEQKSTVQAIPLSRRVLNKEDHGDIVKPILEYIKLGKKVKKILKALKIEGGIGFDKDVSVLLKSIAQEYSKDKEATVYASQYGKYKDDKKVVFSNTEAEAIYDLYSGFQNLNVETKTITTVKQLKNIDKKVRQYTMENDEIVEGSIIEAKDDNSFSVKLKRTPEQVAANEQATIRQFTAQTKISYNSSTVKGDIQKTLDDIFKVNSGIASKNMTRYDKDGNVILGFTNQTPVRYNDGTEVFMYSFMSLIGSKDNLIKKNDTENYQDVFEILENMFTFDKQNSISKPEFQLRVPVPVFKRSVQGTNTSAVEETINYDLDKNENTTQSNEVANSRYFEHNFENMLGSQVYVSFDKTAPVFTPAPAASSAPNSAPIFNQSEIEKYKNQTLPRSNVKLTGNKYVDYFIQSTTNIDDNGLKGSLLNSYGKIEGQKYIDAINNNRQLIKEEQIKWDSDKIKDSVEAELKKGNIKIISIPSNTADANLSNNSKVTFKTIKGEFSLSSKTANSKNEYTFRDINTGEVYVLPLDYVSKIEYQGYIIYDSELASFNKTSATKSPFEELKEDYNNRIETLKKNGMPEAEAKEQAWKETNAADQNSAIAMYNDFKGTSKDVNEKVAEFIKNNSTFNPFNPEITTLEELLAAATSTTSEIDQVLSESNLTEEEKEFYREDYNNSTDEEYKKELIKAIKDCK